MTGMESDPRPGAKINMGFTGRSLLPGNMQGQSEGTSERDRETAMHLLEQLAGCATAIREFIVPSYRPERHYMRGPGPACARRGGGRIEARPTLH